MAYNKETGMWEGFIYKIWNNVNDKIYIGQTIKSINERFMEHIYLSRMDDDCRNKHYIHRAISKYGENKFHIQEILKISRNDINNLKQDLNYFEQYYICNLKSLSTERGYNISNGGQNKSYLEKSVDKYTIDGVFLETFQSVNCAAKIENISSGLISSCCKGKISVCNGSVWRYHGEPFNKYSVKINTGYFKTKKVNCYSLDNIFLKTYDSISDAGRDVGLKNSYHITNVCRGKRNKAGGYKWYYADDINQPDKNKIIK